MDSAPSQAKLSLLLVEDSEDDALLLLHELSKGGLKPDYLRVDSPDDLQAALQQQSWDLVISDHNLPGFDSIRTLQIVKNTHQDLPVIIVSGSIGEDLAVETMKSGASDYIMKDNLARLIPAIERELREKIIRQEKRQAEATIQHLAFHDSLTGLVNRTEFERRLEEVISCSQCKDDLQHALLYMDLDQFKLVNDTCGHAAGDDLLQQLSGLLHKRIRDSDTLSRVGGDEFCLLLESCSISQAKGIAENLRQLVKGFRFAWQDKVFTLGVSIGIAVIDSSSHSASETLSNADLACYAAKDMGRNCIQVYQEQDQDMIRRRGEMDWATRIDNALSQQSFLLYYQPIMPLKPNGVTSHCEILLRLQGEDNSIIPPGAFIPAAERYQRMTAIDRWVIEHTFTHLDKTGSPEQKMTTINLSGQSLSDAGLYDFVRAQLKQWHIHPHSICFEITETAAIARFRNALEFIDKVKSLGCRFALDDFGSGLSSFSYLKTLKVDFLKIDGAFVRNIIDDPMDMAIVEAINKIGHHAGIKTIAEYVETSEIKDCLNGLGVDYVQGYAIGKPSPLEDD